MCHPRPSAVAGLTGEAARAPAETGVREPGGWTRAVFPIESEDRALADFLALGTEAEVVEPQALRSRLAATARAVAERHDAP
ncbi:hypothetical protein CGZ69_30795 [Streptomyces peucetius subsp. caesius ATCC 27952]|nr:hypothetical protein CGZ69_30795 [Streptomyces peucetius subsp. caesius ATCC 27952]